MSGKPKDQDSTDAPEGETPETVADANENEDGVPGEVVSIDPSAAVKEASDNVKPDAEDAAESAEPLADELDGIGLIEVDPQVAALEKELNDLQARLRTVSAAYQRQQEEMTATRERLQRQANLKEEMRRGEVVATLFEPLENLRRSIGAVKSGASAEDTTKGLDMVLNQFMESFEKLGLEEVPGKGARFDPNLHEALSLVPVTDPALDETVLEVFSAGFRIGSRLIQPARVVVGQYQEPVGEA